jgi:hypothetical protein
MLPEVTPRDEVLAWLTGTADELDAWPVVWLPADVDEDADPDEEEEPQAAVPTRTAPITAMPRIHVVPGRRARPLVPTGPRIGSNGLRERMAVAP